MHSRRSLRAETNMHPSPNFKKKTRAISYVKSVFYYLIFCIILCQMFCCHLSGAFIESGVIYVSFAVVLSIFPLFCWNQNLLMTFVALTTTAKYTDVFCKYGLHVSTFEIEQYFTKRFISL